MEQFAAYSHAITSLALWGLLIVILSVISTRGRTPENRCDCGKPKRNYADRAYRSERAFMNAVETSGAFVSVVVAAILAGADPFWVNVLASVFLISRVVKAVVHIATTNEGLRSASYIVGWLCIIIIGICAVCAVFL